jgi:TMEM175 potassium channel family protein
VFAIATTLLVLEIKVPTETPEGHEISTAQELISALVGLWPSYFGYFLGFSTIVIMWINHHHMLSLIRRTDHGLLLLNSLLLLFIAIVPFPTALAAEYLVGEGGTREVAAVVYSGLCLAIAISYNLLWWHMAKGNRLIDRRVDLEEVRGITRSYYFGPTFYGLALLLSFFNGLLGLGLCALLAIFFALPNRVVNMLSTKRRQGLGVGD